MPKLIDTVAIKRTAAPTMNWDGRTGGVLISHVYLNDDDDRKTKLRIYSIKTTPVDKDVNGSPQVRVALRVCPDWRSQQADEPIYEQIIGAQYADQIVERMKLIAQKDHDELVAAHNTAYAESHPKKAYDKSALKNIGDAARWNAGRIIGSEPSSQIDYLHIAKQNRTILRAAVRNDGRGDILLHADVSVGALPPLSQETTPRPAADAMKPAKSPAMPPSGATPRNTITDGGTRGDSNRGPAMGEMTDGTGGMGDSMPKDAQKEMPPPVGGVPEGLEGAQPPPPDAAPMPSEGDAPGPEADAAPERPLTELIEELERDIAELKQQVNSGETILHGQPVEPVESESDPGLGADMPSQNQSPAGATPVGGGGPPGGVPKGAALPDDHAPQNDAVANLPPEQALQQLISIYETLYAENKALEEQVKQNKDVLGVTLDAIAPLMAIQPAQQAFYEGRIVTLQSVDANIVPYKQVLDELKLVGNLSDAQKKVLESIQEQLRTTSTRRKLKFTDQDPTKKTSDAVEEGQTLGMGNLDLAQAVNDNIDAFKQLEAMHSSLAGTGFAAGAARDSGTNYPADAGGIHDSNDTMFDRIREDIADMLWVSPDDVRMLEKHDKEEADKTPSKKDGVVDVEAGDGHPRWRLDQMIDNGEEALRHQPRQEYLSEGTKILLNKLRNKGQTRIPSEKYTRSKGTAAPPAEADPTKPHPSRTKKRGVDEDAAKYYKDDLYGTDSTKGYGESLVENKVDITDKIAMIFSALVKTGVKLSDDQIANCVEMLDRRPMVHGAFIRYITSSKIETRAELLDRVFELSQENPRFARTLYKVMLEHLIKTSDLLNRTDQPGQKIILDSAMQANPRLVKKLRRLCDSAVGVDEAGVAPKGPQGASEMITAALEMTAAAMPKMTAPKVRKGEDDAVDVLKMEDAAKDYEGPSPGTIDFKLEEKSMQGNYLFMGISWDPDEVTVGGQGLELALKKFVQSVVSHRAPVNYGYSYTAVIKKLDPKKGKALIQVKIAGNADAPLAVSSTSKSESK